MEIVTYHYPRGFLILLALAFLIGCTPLFARKSVACDQLIEESLRQLDFDQVNPDSFSIWVSTTYKLPASQIVDEPYDPEDSAITEVFKWRANGKLYHADFVGSELRRIEVQWDTFRPTADEATRCLGTPEFYLAYHELVVRPQLDFQLWYPEQGVVVRSFLPQRLGRVRLTKEMKMEYAFLTRPAPPQEMIRDVLIGNTAEIQQQRLGLLKSWPGSWEATSIDVDPALQE